MPPRIGMLDFGQPGAFGGGGSGGYGVGGGDVLASPNVSIQPASFNETTVLGRAAKITYNPTSDQLVAGIKQTETVAFWQGKKIEAQAMSVDIGMVLPPLNVVTHDGTPSTSLSARAYALIEWGIDGYRQSSVVVDVGLGRRFVLVATYIAVTVGMDPPEAGKDAPILTIGAGIGTFAALTSAPVTRTVYLDSYSSPSITLTPIPNRATLVLPPSGPMASNPIVEVRFYDYSGAQINEWRFDYTAGTGLVPAVIPPDAFWFAVHSTADGNYRIPFQLSL